MIKFFIFLLIMNEKLNKTFINNNNLMFLK